MGKINYEGRDPWGQACAFIQRETIEDYIKWNIIAEAFNKYNIEQLEKRLNENNIVISIEEFEEIIE